MKINKKTALKIALALKGLTLSLTSISLIMDNKTAAIIVLISGAVLKECVDFLKEAHGKDNTIDN